MKRNFMFLSFLLICCFLFDSCGKKHGTSQVRTPNQTNTSGTPVVNNSTPGSGSADDPSSNVVKPPFTFHAGDKFKLMSLTLNEAILEITTAAGGVYIMTVEGINKKVSIGFMDSSKVGITIKKQSDLLSFSIYNKTSTSSESLQLDKTIAIESCGIDEYILDKYL